jgi:predicted branched-subunit amino acid permease
MADFTAVFLAVAAEQLSRASTHQSTFCHVAAVVRVVVVITSFFTDVNHAVIAAVVLITIAATADLRDRIVGTQLTS